MSSFHVFRKVRGLKAGVLRAQNVVPNVTSSPAAMLLDTFFDCYYIKNHVIVNFMIGQILLSLLLLRLLVFWINLRYHIRRRSTLPSFVIA